jgi:uncharacterized Zn finger protein
LELTLEELNEACAHILHVMAQLRRMPEGNDRDTLEGELYAALTHVQREATVALEEWNKWSHQALADLGVRDTSFTQQSTAKHCL